MKNSSLVLLALVCIYLNLHSSFDVDNTGSLTARRRSTRTDLMSAIIEENIEEVKALLLSKADVNAHDAAGITALHYAVRGGIDKIVSLLLFNKDIAVDKQTIDGDTPLISAAQGEYSTIVELLLDAKADVNKANSESSTALIEAVKHKNKKIVQQLLIAGADISKVDSQGDTALLKACKIEATECIDVLTNTAETEQHAKFADNKVNDLISHYLIDEYIKIPALRRTVSQRYSDRKNDQLLIEAIQEGNTEDVQFLLIKGANVNAQDSMGNTPLMWSIFVGDSNLVKLLLEAKADINKKNKSGQTALECAQAHENKEIAALFHEHLKKTEPAQTQIVMAPTTTTGHSPIIKLLINKSSKK